MSGVGTIALANMMHAVGHMRRNGRYTRHPYRNYYAAGSCDVSSWNVLVDLKLAYILRPARDGLEPTYAVTEAGLEFIRALEREKRKKAREARKAKKSAC